MVVTTFYPPKCVLVAQFNSHSTLYSELWGIAVTVFVLDVLARRREERRVKAQLIREMGSSDNGISRRAVRELRESGALQDGSLKNAFLPFSNLKEADLMWANLEAARLDGALLQKAWLDNAHLYKASLNRANLQGVHLVCANFPRANLSDAVLADAHMDNAELAYANLSGAKFNTDTILPDCANWTPDTDMARFTDPSHPDFWRSDDPNSPAYLGETNEG